MNDERPRPRLTSEGAQRADARQDRLAKALRQNLMKRKAQQRARDGAIAAPALPPAESDRGGER